MEAKLFYLSASSRDKVGIYLSDCVAVLFAQALLETKGKQKRGKKRRKNKNDSSKNLIISKLDLVTLFVKKTFYFGVPFNDQYTVLSFIPCILLVSMICGTKLCLF